MTGVRLIGSTKWMMRWDNDYFYLAIDVTDDKLQVRDRSPGPPGRWLGRRGPLLRTALLVKAALPVARGR